MARLTDTQLIILSAASQRDDGGVKLPANAKGEAAGRVADKLIRAGLLEEVGASGSLPIWRRDDSGGAMALRITKTGLAAIDAADEAAPPGDKRSFCFHPRNRNTCPRSHRLPQADFRCGTEVRRYEAWPR